ncbi:AI-2E family transporter [Salinisphaera sp. SPP-AMP-43]|uniref:AI-2E family transporter n=1 Tax=Salinisphaera sp. SPP-AMP-43 TaxID=3121288 RepID=UPI003C6E108F
MVRNSREETRDFWRRSLIVAATALGVVALLWFAWAVGHAVLLIFAAFLVAVGLDALGRVWAKLTRMSRHASVMSVTTLLALVLGISVVLGAMNIVSQAPKLRDQVAQSIDQFQARLRHYQIAEEFVTQSMSSETSSSSKSDSKNESNSFGERMTRELSSAASVTLTTLADLFVVVIIGIYLALRPKLYYDGLLRLCPPQRQAQARLIGTEAVDAVRRWLSGRAISMSVVGVGSVVGLWAIDIQFPLLLGLSAGLLTFIPYLGALVSAVPALLIAGLHGFWPMVYVGLLYLILHIVEGYMLAPLIQRRTASIAPAFLLSVQVIGGAIAGVLGVSLAAPISLVITVIIQLTYVQEVIGEEPHLPSDGPRDEPAD